ncbi:hypothetical protein [Pseudaminobacter soli (ex Li et al. 2025)]|uniref:hypothetical protein n=1 Tax=Pseudaminobacter soli (ex Li et al. 2025) TaxID=1295366 RepID=UPI0011B293C3|nr:hypothetical protein [Mesorhizobium soli]
MHNQKKMRHPEAQVFFERWIELTTEWEIAYSHYLAALKDKLVDEGLGNHPSDDLRAVEDQALQRLKSLKVEMDTLVEQAASNRPQIKSELVVGMLVSGTKPWHDK